MSKGMPMKGRPEPKFNPGALKRVLKMLFKSFPGAFQRVQANAAAHRGIVLRQKSRVLFPQHGLHTV